MPTPPPFTASRQPRVMCPQPSDPVFQNSRFRDCIHRDVAAPTTEALVAAVTAEFCAPACPSASPPVDAGAVFIGVAQVLGETLFRDVWSEFQNRAAGRKPHPMDFAAFLAEHRLGRTLPPLADLAAFDFAAFLAAQPSPMLSIAACCLPEAVIRNHPELILRFQPGWRYLDLNWPVHRLLSQRLTGDRLRSLPGGSATGLRIAPEMPGIAMTELAPASFRLQQALRNGERLSEAIELSAALDPALDPYPVIAGLVEAGAIADAILHPTAAALSSNPLM